MDLKQIEKLMAFMERSRMRRLVWKTEEFEVELERECASPMMAPLHMAQPLQYAPFPREAPGAEPTPTAPAPVVNARYVTSPMVGTFYAAPSPEDPAFVKVGDWIEEQTVVCILEAMKVMNEVKAGLRGRVAEVLLKSGDPVEFGTKILRIESV